MEQTYWKKQSADKPLYPDIEWSKPEQLSQKGKLGIVGGNSLGFAGVAEAYNASLTAGAGTVKVLLPDVLKKSIPKSISNVIYGPTNPSGGLSGEASESMKALADWSDAILLVGDAGRNSETAILYEDFLADYTGHLLITRDAFDLIKNSGGTLVDRPNTTLVLSFAQLQKLFQTVYYPKILTFKMQLSLLVETLHKFTITYPSTIVVFHDGNIVISQDGKVNSMIWDNPMDIWRGKTAAIAVTYLLWNPSKPLESITASLLCERV